MPSAIQGYLGVGVESTAGTSVAPTKFLPVKSVDFDTQQDQIVIREIGGTRQAQRSFGGSIRPSITFDTAFYPAGAMGTVLRGLFGASTSALEAPSTIAYTHSFVDAAVLPSLSFERSETAGAGGVLHERVPGCKIESVSFSAEFGAEVNVTVNAQGLKFPEDPASKPGSITLPAMDPFIFTGVSIDIDGTPSDLFKSLDFDFTNTLEPQESLRQSREAFAIHEGPIECSLSGTMIFNDQSVYNLFKTQEEFEVTANFVGGIADEDESIPYGATFTWHRVKVLNFSAPMEAEGVMEAQVEFTVSYDTTLNRFVTVTMTNLDATGAYAT